MVSRNAPQALPRAPDVYDRTDEQQTRDMIDRAIRDVRRGLGSGSVSNSEVSSTDNSVARFDGVTGSVIQGSSAILDDDGNLSLEGEISSALAIIRDAAGTARSQKFQTLTSDRWTQGANSTAEAGANAGSDFDLTRYSDAGSAIEVAMRVARASGLGTFRRDLRVGANDAEDRALRVSGATGYNRLVGFETNGAYRFTMGVDGSAEAGANAGSDLVVYRFDDAGSYIDSPFAISRANGATYFGLGYEDGHRVISTSIGSFNALNYGLASGTGAAAGNVTALQAGLDAAEGGILVVPPGTWYYNALLTVHSNTTIHLTAGCILKAYHAGWSGSNYTFRNENHSASSLTDANINLIGHGTIDNDGRPGDHHAWYMRYVNGSLVEHVTCIGGGNFTSFLACRITRTYFATALDVGNCGFDHWDSPADGIVYGCLVDGSPAQGIQATGCDTSLAEGHGYNMRFMFNTVRNVTNGSGTASAVIFNTGSSTSSMRECLSAFNKIEDCDLGVVFEGLGEQRTSHFDTFIRVTGLPIFFHNNFGDPTDCRVVGPELIDCDHDPANVAMIAISGTRNFVWDIKLRNTGGSAAYDLVVWFVTGSSSCKAQILTGNKGASGYYSDSGTSNDFGFYFPIKTTVATLAARGATVDKPGQEAYATDGRKTGEGVGAGTGCKAWWDGTNWLTMYDNSVLAA